MCLLFFTYNYIEMTETLQLFRKKCKKQTILDWKDKRGFKVLRNQIRTVKTKTAV